MEFEREYDKKESFIEDFLAKKFALAEMDDCCRQIKNFFPLWYGVAMTQM